MTKTTKTATPSRALQTFTKTNIINSITLGGDTELADVAIDGQGDVLLSLHRDTTKIDKIKTTSELITVTKHGTTVTIGLDQQKLEELIATLIH